MQMLQNVIKVHEIVWYYIYCSVFLEDTNFSKFIYFKLQTVFSLLIIIMQRLRAKLYGYPYILRLEEFVDSWSLKAKLRDERCCYPIIELKDYN